MFVKELQDCADGTRINSHYSISDKRGVQEYTKGWMFRGKLSDKTGKVDIVFFGPNDEGKVGELYGSLIPDSIVEINGKLSTYRNEKQIVVNGKAEMDYIIPAHPTDYDLAKFLHETNQDPEELWNYLLRQISTFESPHLKALLEKIFEDEKTRHLFRTVPGARLYHHACVAGLLEHVWETTQYCDLAYMIHPSMDHDLIITGAILHDIGKIMENIVVASIEETREGMLLGHVHLGIQIIREKLRDLPDFPKELETKLLHIILSHHGAGGGITEIRPMTAEAITVATADMIGSNVTQYIRARKDTREQGFKAYVRPIGRVFIE